MKIFFHLVWVLPLSLGYFYLGGALLLVVVLTYIKSIKISRQIQHIAQRPSPLAAKEIETLTRLQNFWQKFTFLKKQIL